MANQVEELKESLKLLLEAKALDNPSVVILNGLAEILSKLGYQQNQFVDFIEQNSKQKQFIFMDYMTNVGTNFAMPTVATRENVEVILFGEELSAQQFITNLPMTVKNGKVNPNVLYCVKDEELTIEPLKFLGLGSMVEVDDMDALKDTKYVVFARAVGKNSEGGTILRYMLAPHPFGDVPKQKDNILTVEGSQITKVHVGGYVDKKDDQFLEEFLVNMGQLISKASESSSTPPTPQEDEDSKKAAQFAKEKAEKEEVERLEQERERLRRDPFYKFRKKVEE